MREARAKCAGLILLAMAAASSAADFPRGFFVEDLRSKPAKIAFYNLDTQRMEPLALLRAYGRFIDFAWDQPRGRVFFSAREKSNDPFRVYLKEWPAGEEKIIYENPVGPFRFQLSPDGTRIALQIMGPAAWPTLAIHEWEVVRTVVLGEGYSPDWSVDSRRLLFLRIPGSLPSYLAEYRVETDTATVLLREPVMEAVYTDDPDQIILKTEAQSKRCNVFQIWNRRNGRFSVFSAEQESSRREGCATQRELNAFPGHRFFYFKESPRPTELREQSLVVADVWGGRLQALSREEWAPGASAVEPTTLLVGEDPLYVMRADGTGGRREIPQAGFIRFKK
jgi:hypothetical protein